MANQINMKREIESTLDIAIERATKVLKEVGFGVLTRIDLHSKFKEKLGKEVPAVVILGACNPQLAYEAYSKVPDVTSLLPCNAVVREISTGKISVEFIKPSALMAVLGDTTLVELAAEVDVQLLKALESL